MPKLSPGQPFGPIPATVTLDGSGNGAVQFQATGSAARITNLFGKVSTATNQAVVSVYVGTIADTNRVFNNNSGSTGFTAQGSIDVPDGTIIYIVWTGGDAGAIATATFSGRAIPFDQITGGFEMRADDPIAAGDGSLIFPAIKSPNFQSGVSGWRISRDGVAEFLNAIIRGSIDVASGIVRINSSGIYVEDATHLFLVNTTGGFQSINKPADGSYVAMQDQAMFFQPVDPYNGSATTAGSIAAFALTDGSDYTGLTLRSPTINGMAQANIRLWSESASGTSGPLVDLSGNLSTTITKRVRLHETTDITNINTGEERYGRGRLAQVNRSSAFNITGTETVTLTFPSITYEANRAYKVSMDSLYVGGVANTNPGVNLRKTSAAGALIVNGGRLGIPATNTQFQTWNGHFITGGSAVTASLVITLATSVGTPTQNPPTLATMWDMGPDTLYSGSGVSTLT